jgi:AbrB family looped-hinge helix DNA binding protein
MELAKVTTRGQITLPLAIRKKLGVKEGDKVVFLEREDGRIVIENSAMLALKEAQEAFQGEAARAGLQTEEDVTEMVKEIRREHGRARNA